MIPFLWGAIASLCAVAGLFFFKFWRQTRDRLFFAFALGFATLSLHWAALGILHPSNETKHYLFFVRLLAFAFIIAGVVGKNRRPGRPARRVDTGARLE
ncbi:MAG TPA: DUF5985 family protein [Polyangiaceae bacterium]|nr:DUF5985 family protein [Polyangiaceae bacterium]